VLFSSGIYLNFVFGSWSYFDWHHHAIYINAHKRPRFVRKKRVVSTRIWQHTPSHRRGVAYRDKRTAQTYGQAPHRSQESRRKSRGYADDRDTIQYTIRNKNKLRKTAEIKNNVSRQEKKHLQQQQQQKQPPRVTRQQPQKRNTRMDQNTRKTVQTKSTNTRLEQQRTTRETQRLPQIRKPAQQKRKEQWQKRESVFNRVDNGTAERQSSRRGKASRQKDPKKQRK
jgi:hypothetical protein